MLDHPPVLRGSRNIHDRVAQWEEARGRHGLSEEIRQIIMCVYNAVYRVAIGTSAHQGVRTYQGEGISQQI